MSFKTDYTITSFMDVYYVVRVVETYNRNIYSC